MQYLRPDWGFFEYPGRYVRADSVISLSFDDSNAAGEWLGYGILSGDTLIVTYNLIMALADFEDGAYVSASHHSANAANIHIPDDGGSSVRRIGRQRVHHET